MNKEPSEEESLKKTKKLLLKWKNDKNIQKLKEFYDTKSFSAILGVERNEMSHSSFISWILNDKESHHLGQFAIKQLLDILLEYGEEKIKNSLEIYNQENTKELKFDNLYKALMLNSYIIKDLEIGVEQDLEGYGRIDIIVSMTIQSSKEDIELPERVNVIIENKVDSSEHGKQTEKYYEYYTTNSKYKNDLNIFVFLLPIATSKLSEQLAECKHFININYQLLADNIFERALNHDISDRVRFIISEYLLSLRKPSKKGIVMAIGKLEEELLKDFWEKHQKLLMQMFPIIADLEEDEDNAKTLRDVADKMNKNFTRYDNLDDYIDKVLTNRTKGNIDRLRILMDKIKSVFDDTIEITYAPSKINIKNPNAKKGKVFVYIDVKKDIIKLEIMAPQKIDIKLSNENEIKDEKDDYMNKLKTAFESLEN